MLKQTREKEHKEKEKKKTTFTEYLSVEKVKSVY